MKLTKYIVLSVLFFAVISLEFGRDYFSRVYYSYQIQKLTAQRQSESVKNPMVSVILPTYNRENMLPRAIDSILNQTFKDFELIVINDGSKDNTAKILYDYMLRDPRIIGISRIKNRGLIAELNTGLETARGKYIARMDDDDFSHADRLEKQARFMEENQDVAMAGTFVSTGRSDIDKQWSETDPNKTKIMHYLGITPVCHPAIMVRSDFLKQHHIKYRNDYVHAEDRPFYGEILDAGGKISNVPEVLFDFRIHASNSAEYYKKQEENVLGYHLAYLNRIVSVNVVEYYDKCQLLEKIRKYAEDHDFVDPLAIEAMQARYGCFEDQNVAEDL